MGPPQDEFEAEADAMPSSATRGDVPERQRPLQGTQRIDHGFQPELTAKRAHVHDRQPPTAIQKTVDPAESGQKDKHIDLAKVDEADGGQPLSPSQRAFFEPRFGVDFRRVRVHTNESADAAARVVGAIAFTRGSDLVFRRGYYRPDTSAGRQLLAHELAHVVQQRAIRSPSWSQVGERRSAKARNDSRVDTASTTRLIQMQPFPGQGMFPPGDCSFSTYLALRGAVESAKAIVSTLGACRLGDSCTFLAAKIAAITAEIVARVTLDATCFRGGDAGHRQQVQDKVNMVNRCYRFFTNSNCPQQLIEAMEAVIERAREVVAAVALAIAVVAAVALLIAAIVLLVKAIIAAGAAAAAAAGAAAVLALLMLVLEHVSPESPPTA